MSSTPPPAGRSSVQKGCEGGPKRSSMAALSSQRVTEPEQPAALPPRRCYSPKKKTENGWSGRQWCEALLPSLCVAVPLLPGLSLLTSPLLSDLAAGRDETGHGFPDGLQGKLCHKATRFSSAPVSNPFLGWGYFFAYRWKEVQATKLGC